MARKKKPGRREPNGRRSRRIADRPATSQEAADNMSVVIDARMRMHGLTREKASQANGGFALGRAFERLDITKNQLTAAQYYLADRNAYHRGILAPQETKEPHVKPSGDDQSYENFVKRAKERWESVQEIIEECCREEKNNLPRQALEFYAVRDIEAPRHIGALRTVLNALVGHYLVGRRKAA
jgi:hypothetical protein